MIMSDTIRLHGLVKESVVDGLGYRTAIFTQGCPHHCAGCHNPESHALDGGTEWMLDAVEERFAGNPLLEGITLSGGEPFLQAEACGELARRAHRLGLTVWTFSGYTYEELLRHAEKDANIMSLLQETDVLVDGRFDMTQRSLELLYCGSKNQRLIDLRKTRKLGKLVLFTPPEW